MPSVVMVNAVCSGSHGRIMSDIGRAAQAAGFRTHIAFARGAANGADIRIGSMRDVYLHVAATRLLDRHGRASRRATERLTRQLADLRPDVLHLHNAHGYYLHYETFFAFLRQSGIPTVWTLHDCWAITGHCSHFVRANCMRWRDGCHRCPLRREYPQSWLWDASRENWRRKRDAFSALPNLTLALPSRWLEGVVADSFLRDVPRRVIPNGVDLSLFSPRGDGGQTRSALGIGPEEPLLLAVAAPFDARKGYADALEVARRTRGRARVVLVGLTPAQLRSLPEGVVGLARTEGPEALVSLLSAADCLLNPTYEDTYPTVNMEAMASGTPVAAYAVGGCVEQLEAPVGMTVPCGNAQALAEAALALAARKGALAGECRAYAQARFDRAQAVEQYVALYQKKIEDAGKLC